jgi:large subunit ribosomal protein L24
MSKWIKKEDQVIVIAGNDKGKRGKVLRRLGDRVVVQGINVRKKHVKSKSREMASRILELEMPIDISNVSLCDLEGKPIKLKVRQTSDGNKELFYLDGEKQVVHRQLRKGA